MFKLITLAIGFILGTGTGLWLSVNKPELSAKLFQKQNELIEEGKRQAIEEIKQRLDQLVAKQEAAPPKSTGTAILGLVAGGTTTAAGQTSELKALSAELDKQLTTLGGPTGK